MFGCKICGAGVWFETDVNYTREDATKGVLMHTVPLIVLALQPGAPMTVQKAESLLRSCVSQGVLYWVVCCECNPPPPAVHIADDMSKRAYDRALHTLGLPEYQHAVAAIGLHSHSVRLHHGLEVRKASLALIERDAMDKPFLLDMSGNSPATHARLVAEGLRNWRKHKGAVLRGTSVADELALARWRKTA